MTNPFSAAALVGALLLAAGGLPAGVAAAEAVSSEPPRWHQRVAPALAEAEVTGKLILVDLYADWCGWCKRLEAELSTPLFARFAQDYVLLRVNVEDGAEGTALQEYLGVRALPTLALMDHRKVRAGLVEGFKPAPALTAAIRRTAAGWHAEVRSLEQQLAEGDRRERLAAADALRAMGNGEAAAEAYRQALEQPDLATSERVRLGAALTDSLLLADDAEGARDALQAARHAAAELEGGEPAAATQQLATGRLLDTLALRLAQRLADCQQAAALEDFLREHPSSTVAATARDRLDRLRAGPAADCS